MAKVIEVQSDNRIVIVSNEPVGYPNFASKNIRLTYAEYERLNMKYGGHYGINWYLLGDKSVKYFDSAADEWRIVRR